jgi:hypothetical protein
VQLCIVKKQPSKDIQCIKYCIEICFNESKICIIRIVGESVIHEIENEMHQDAAASHNKNLKDN